MRLSFWVLLLVVGCGGARASAKKAPAADGTLRAEPDAPSEDPDRHEPGATGADGQALESVDDAAQAFEAAEAELEGFLAEADPTPLEGGAEAAELEDGAAPAPPRAAPQANAEATGCLRACRALGSMRRSAERLCQLTGAEDPRCHNVTERFERASEAVSERCPSCQL